MAGACECGREPSGLQGFGGETLGTEPLGRPRSRWEDNIKMDVKEEGSGGMNWIDLAQDRCRALVNAVVNLRVYRVSVEKPEGKNHLEDPGVDG